MGVPGCGAGTVGVTGASPGHHRARSSQTPVPVPSSPSLSPAVSNEVPEHPCVSPVSNHVYERRLIEKYIAENGTDPVNNQPLSEEQLIDIKGTGNGHGKGSPGKSCSPRGGGCGIGNGGALGVFGV